MKMSTNDILSESTDHIKSPELRGVEISDLENMNREEKCFLTISFCEVLLRRFRMKMFLDYKMLGKEKKKKTS